MSTHSYIPPRTLLIALALSAIGALTPDASTAQELTYTIEPSFRWIEWDDELDFERSRLFGGQVNIGFGRYVGLSAFYHEDGSLTLLSDSAFAAFETKLIQTGGAITLSLGTGSVVPVIQGGASILRFRPAGDAIEEFTKLSFDYGGGLRAVLGEWLSAEVLVESSEYRLARERLTAGSAAADEPIRHNLSLRAGLGIQLGRRTFDRAAETDAAFDSPFDNFGVALEPRYGRFTFADELGIEDQDAWGARAGFDFGSFFGLRGFYWRGTEEDDAGDFNEFQAWGGEAQFNLGAGPGIHPFLVGGVTHFDWDADVPGAALIDGRNAITLGGGIDLEVTERLSLSASARDHILAGADVGGDLLENVSDPDDLLHNWQFSVGVSIELGRGSGQDPRPARDVGPMAAAPALRAPVGARAPASAAAPADTIRVRVPGTPDTRVIMLPVLENGEIYIRFGESGASPFVANRAGTAAPERGVSEEELRRVVREEVDAMRSDGVSMEALMLQLRELETRLQARLDQVASGGALDPQPRVVTAQVQARNEPSVSRRSRELRPYAGLSFGDASQLVVGIAADLGPLNAGSAFNILPQFAFGIGEGRPTYLANVSLEYRLNEFALGDRVELTPLVSAGPSVVRQDDTRVTLTTFFGTGLRLLAPDGSERIDLFTGFQGVDLLDDGRWLLGLRLTR
jgi:hypothetical protein